MTVYRSVDEADFWASYKQAKRAAQDQEINRTPMIIEDCFKVLDDLQRICHDGCQLDAHDIGSIQAKLTILRINLNVHFHRDTPQLH
jgi:hypothetical protein